MECQLSELQTSKHISQPNGLPIYCFLINAHIPWCQLHDKTALHVCILPHSIVGGLAFQVLLFCCHLFIICDPACAVVLRRSSVTPQKRKRCLLSIKQKLEICDRLRNGWSYLRISAEYGIGKSTVFDIKLEDKLKAFQSQLQNENCMKKRCIIRTADFFDVDKAVFLWFV